MMNNDNSGNIICGPYTLNYQQKTLLMGILNATPDSFSDGGKYNDIDTAVKHALDMVEQGVDIIDVGGESTRPGSENVTLEEELSRVIPIIEAVSQEVSVPISVDTYKSEVAKQAIEAGAHIINDVWGAKADPQMAHVAATYNVPIILMHNRDNRKYRNFKRDVFNDLFASITIAKKAGVSDDNIILDPGIGFAKDQHENVVMMQNLEQLVAFGYPVLLGTSRKSMIGNILNCPPNDRLEGTIATVCFGIQKGCQIVRVHDVKEISRTIKVMDELMGKGR